jgi:hypothetical protein
VEDVAGVSSGLLANAQPHTARSINDANSTSAGSQAAFADTVNVAAFCGPQSENMYFYGQEYSKTLGIFG